MNLFTWLRRKIFGPTFHEILKDLVHEIATDTKAMEAYKRGLFKE